LWRHGRHVKENRQPQDPLVSESSFSPSGLPFYGFMGYTVYTPYLESHEKPMSNWLAQLCGPLFLAQLRNLLFVRVLLITFLQVQKNAGVNVETSFKPQKFW